MACEGGNDKDIDACVEETKGTEATAEAYGCGDELDQLFECSEPKFSCKEKKYRADDACADQAKALSACINAASSRGDD